jgi:hypothetical protein
MNHLQTPQVKTSIHDFAVFLGLMANLDGKPEGNNSMPGK